MVQEFFKGIDPSSSVSVFWAYLIATFLAILIPVLLLWSLGGRSPKPRLPLPPGSLGWPLVGETLHFLLAVRKNEGLRAWVLARAARCGPLFKTHILGSPTVVMDPPQGNRFLFQNEGIAVEHDWPGSFFRLFGPNSLAVKAGDEYRLARRHFYSFLDHGAVLRYIKGVERNAVQHFDRHWDGKDEVAALQMARTFTFAIIASLLISPQDGREVEHLRGLFVTWAAGVFSLEVDLPGFTFHYALKARKAILQVLDGYIARRRSDLAEGRLSEAEKVDVLTSLLTVPNENGEYASDGQIKDNLLMFLIAGYDTSSVVLGMTIMLIGKNPHVYSQLVEEHKAIVQRKRALGEGEGLRHEDIVSMKLSWRVIQEALRLQPPVTGTFRKAIKDIEYNGFFIPKGWKFMWNTMLSHYNPDFFKDPLTFDPSRWEEQAVPFTFLPFGAGQRMCPGYEFAKMEILVFLHHLIRRYRWTLTDPNEPIVRTPFPHAVKLIPIRITPVDLL